MRSSLATQTCLIRYDDGKRNENKRKRGCVVPTSQCCVGPSLSVSVPLNTCLKSRNPLFNIPAVSCQFSSSLASLITHYQVGSTNIDIMSSSIDEQSLTAAVAAWTLTSDSDKNGLSSEYSKKALITSALPYVNNVPHLGNIIGSLLSADVFARYCRLRERETLFICGTDEYGTATETKALEEGVTPEEICARYHAIHKDIYQWFNLSFDHFGRTSTENQTVICQDLFWKLFNNKYIYEESVDQLYCPSCARFLADRFVEGTCPFCSFEDARGDQCDSCGKLINAPDLKNARCKLCRSSPELKTSRHLFLDLPKLESKVREWYENTISKESCSWTQTARVIAASWLKEGELKGRCITRDLKWGTKVPLEGFEDKVFYVWFDAPIGYLSITKALIEDWGSWWKNPDNVELYQFMAKDNVPFHAIIMPATQIGSGENFTLVNHLVAVEYLNYEDSKFSKSRGVGVFGNDARDTNIPSDVWRFYLIYIRPENQDSSFNWEDLMLKNNSELLSNLGNFFNRALAFVKNSFGGIIQEVILEEKDKEFLANVNSELETYFDLMDRAKLRDGLKQLLKISTLGNQYMQANKPWELVKSEDTKNRAGSVISLLANLTALLSILLSPFIPSSCRTLREQLNFSSETFKGRKMIQLLPAGHVINQPSPLFRKIEEKEIKQLKEKFAGKSQSGSQTNDIKEVSVNVDGKSAEEVTQLITEQGDKIRSLKTSKAEKSVIDKEVAILKQLKSAYEKITGSPFDPPKTAKTKK